MGKNRNQTQRIRSGLAIAAAAATSAMMQQAAMGQVSYSGGSYVQNFSGLTNADQQQWLQNDGKADAAVAPVWTDNSTLPGWFAYSPGLSAPAAGINNKQVMFVGDGTPKSFTTWNQGGTIFTPSATAKTTFTGGLYDLGETLSGANSTSAVGSAVRALAATSTSTSGVTTFGVELVNTSASTTYNSVNISALAEEWFSGANPTGGGLTFQYGIVKNTALNPISSSTNTANYQTDTALSFVNTSGGNALVPGGESATSIYNSSPYNGVLPDDPSPFNVNERAGLQLDPAAPSNTGDRATLSDSVPVVWAPGQTLFVGWSAATVSGGPLMAIGNLNLTTTSIPPGAKYLTWTNNAGTSKWNQADINWTNNNGIAGNTSAFTNQDIVYFGNTGVGSVAVDSGGITSSAIYVQNTSGTYTFTGGAIDGGTLQKAGAGTLVLSPTSNNTFQGLQIFGGTVMASSDGALGDPSGGVTLDSNNPNAVDGKGNSIAAAPAVFQSTGLITSSRNWSISGGGGTINVPAAADNMSISGNFYQFGPFVKSGAGQLTLSGQLTAAAASTFSIAAGSVVMAQNTATYEQIVAPSTQNGFVGDLYLNGPFRFAVLGGNVAGGGHVYVEANPNGNSGIYADTPVGGAAGTVTTISNAVVLNTNSQGSPQPMPAGGFTSFLGCSTAGDFLVINGTGVSGNANVVFTNNPATGGGAGELDLNVVNSWTGSTTADMSGPVVLGATGGIPNGTALTFGNGHGGGLGTIDLNGFNLNVSSLATQLLSGNNGGVPITASSPGNISNAGSALSTITVNGSASTTYQGLIGAGTYVNSSGNSGTDNIKLVLASTNTGTLTLTGPNTYSQGTDIEGGTLVIDTYQYTNNLMPPTTTYGSSLPANSNVTNNSKAGFGLVINDGPTAVNPVPSNPSPGTTANQITGTGNTEVSSTGVLTVGTLNQGLVANQGTLTIGNTTTATTSTITNGINNTIAGTSTGGTTTIASKATVTVGNVIQNLLTVNGKLAVTPSIAPPHNPASTSMLNSLVIAGSSGHWTGLFDVGNSAVVVQAANASAANTAEALIYDQLTEAAHYHLVGSVKEDTWDGAGGITSSLLQGAGVTSGYTVGESINTAGLTTFGGKPVNANSILLGYTVQGDANMDGTVDGKDLTIVLNNYGGAGTYGQGDLNYDATVDGADLTLVLNNYSSGITNALAAYQAYNLAADGIEFNGSDFVVVPEPTSLGLLAFSGLLLARRRRIV